MVSVWLVAGFLIGFLAFLLRRRRVPRPAKEEGTAVRIGIVVNGAVPDQLIPLAWPGVTAIAVADPVTGGILRQIVVEVDPPKEGH